VSYTVGSLSREQSAGTEFAIGDLNEVTQLCSLASAARGLTARATCEQDGNLDIVTTSHWSSRVRSHRAGPARLPR
jgi:hypothetical protein